VLDSEKLSKYASVFLELATLLLAVVVTVQWTRGKFGETL
jgi:hypothetical protein